MNVGLRIRRDRTRGKQREKNPNVIAIQSRAAPLMGNKD